jgi:hypothetical protein
MSSGGTGNIMVSPSIRLYVTERIQTMGKKRDGLPNQRPGFMKRAEIVLHGQQWDANAKREREQVEPYRGSKLEREHRRRGEKT